MSEVLKDLRCDHCGGYFGKAYGTVVAELRCNKSNCKGTTQIKIINADVSQDYHHKFLTPPEKPKTKQIEVS